MDYKDIAEQAYKNGYEQGVNDTANKVVAQLLELFPSGKTCAEISLLDIHTILTNATKSGKELTLKTDRIEGIADMGILKGLQNGQAKAN